MIFIYQLVDEKDRIVDVGTYDAMHRKKKANMRIQWLHHTDQPSSHPELWEEATDWACEDERLAQEQCIPFTNEDFDKVSINRYMTLLKNQISRKHHGLTT